MEMLVYVDAHQVNAYLVGHDHSVFHLSSGVSQSSYVNIYVTLLRCL